MIFRKLGIIEPILKVIDKENFEKPSEIQCKAIPEVVAGKDIIAGSATGSGKTLVFGCGIIQNCIRGQGIQSLVMAPTRELAEQVRKVIHKFSKFRPLEVVSVYGGVSINPQMEKLRSADVVVGTPGRLLDHIERRTIDLSRVKILVLDEADRMLDMGFQEDVERIIKECPKKRQTLLFSATIDKEISNIASRYMNNPIKISAVKYVDPSKLKQVYYNVQDNMKFSLLVHLLKNNESGLVMVFSNTRRNVDFVAKNLKLNGVDALGIHGGFTQQKRDKVIEKFHAGKVFILVCTDVAARGLDIPHVSHIYNYDIPKDSKEYIHRIGRTARAGKEGTVVNLLASRDHENFSRVLQLSDVNVTKVETPKTERVKINASKGRSEGRSSFGGRGPRREGNSGRGGRFSDSSGRNPRSGQSRDNQRPRRGGHRGARRKSSFRKPKWGHG